MQWMCFSAKNRADQEKCHEQFKPCSCTETRISRAQARNKINTGDLFDNFPPRWTLGRGGDFLVIADQMLGFLQIYQCNKKSLAEAILKLSYRSMRWCFVSMTGYKLLRQRPEMEEDSG